MNDHAFSHDPLIGVSRLAIITINKNKSSNNFEADYAFSSELVSSSILFS